MADPEEVLLDGTLDALAEVVLEVLCGDVWVLDGERLVVVDSESLKDVDGVRVNDRVIEWLAVLDCDRDTVRDTDADRMEVSDAVWLPVGEYRVVVGE